MLKFNALLSPKFFNSNINTQRLNPSLIGWVRPDNQINFQTTWAAQNYARTKVLQALNADVPFERAVILKKNTVISEVDGGLVNIDQSKLKKINLSGTTFFHGHPEFYGQALPVSLQDFLTQAGNKIKRMVAFNKDGEYSMLSEKQDKKFYDYFPGKIKDFFELSARVGISATAMEKYIKMWTKFFPAPLKDSVKKIMHASIGRELLSGTKAIADGEKLMKNKKLVERIAVLEKELIKSGSASKSIDDFWKANADRWGYKYSTNYSTLKQAPGPL